MHSLTSLALIAMANIVTIWGLSETADSRENRDRAPQHAPVLDAIKQAVQTAARVATWAADTSIESAVAGDSKKSDATNFRPILEAELPEGFIVPEGVGAVELRKYPAYRKAKTSTDGEDRAFMTLFRHIQSNDIAMTAPVEMTLDESGAEMQDMAFLYRSAELGELGRHGVVEVVDVPAGEYLSIGFRGNRDDETIKKGKAALREWLERRDDYKAAGPWRVMGYNSPFVPKFLRYWELHIPVAPRNVDDSVEARKPASNG